ncbi:MAG: hypothetical protein H7Y22_18240 [Gemmatimonadaceae bacterium]|nr:hypothetical protein [Gloeobacterales cyanobacterium ES-bin-141]
MPPATGLEEFLNPTSRYYGPFTLGQLAFNANLQEFANRVGLLVALETGNKITAEEAYVQIRRMWKRLKKSRKLLEPPGGDNQPPTDGEAQ